MDCNVVLTSKIHKGRASGSSPIEGVSVLVLRCVEAAGEVTSSVQALAASSLDLLAANSRGQPSGGAAGGGGVGVEAWGVSPGPAACGQEEAEVAVARERRRWGR